MPCIDLLAIDSLFFTAVSAEKTGNVLDPVNVKPSATNITVTSPRNSCYYSAGRVLKIEWSSQDCGSNVSIDLYYENGTACGSMSALQGLKPNTGQYNWTIPSGVLGVPTGNYKICISNGTNYGYSETFRILNPYILNVHVYPTPANSYNITWSSSGSSDLCCVNIYLCSQDGGVQFMIEREKFNTGNYHWTVPSNVTSGHYWIGIEDSDNPRINAVSNESISINQLSTPGFPVEFAVLGFVLGILGILATVLKNPCVFQRPKFEFKDRDHGYNIFNCHVHE